MCCTDFIVLLTLVGFIGVLIFGCALHGFIGSFIFGYELHGSHRVVDI